MPLLKLRCRLQLKCNSTREGKWRENWRMEWVASTLHTTSEYGVSSITTADAHTSAASSRLNWRWFKWTRPFRRKTKSGFYACAIVFQLASTKPESFFQNHYILIVFVFSTKYTVIFRWKLTGYQSVKFLLCRWRQKISKLGCVLVLSLKDSLLLFALYIIE